MKKLITRATPGTLKVLKWMHVWDQWIQALCQWEAMIFLIFKHQRKYCILIGLEQYPFPSNVYPFGAFIGSCPKLLSYVIKRLTFDRALPALLSISSTCTLIPTHVRLYLLNILRWIKSWKVYYFIAVVMFIMSDQESSIQPTASPGTSVATIAIW